MKPRLMAKLVGFAAVGGLVGGIVIAIPLGAETTSGSVDGTTNPADLYTCGPDIKTTIARASDFSFDNYDDSPEQQQFGYPAHQSLLSGEVNSDSLIIGPGTEGDMGSVIGFETAYYDIPISAKKLIWEMNIAPKTPMLSGSYTSTDGTMTFILQTFVFDHDGGYAISEISHVTGYPIQIEQAIEPHPLGADDPQEAFVTSHGNWACGRLAIHPKIVDDSTTGCTDTAAHPLGKASPFDDWNSASPSETHRFKLEVDYEDWVVRAYIDDMDNPVGETGAMSSDPYQVAFALRSRAAPNRDFHRIYSNIDIYTLTEDNCSPTAAATPTPTPSPTPSPTATPSATPTPTGATRTLQWGPGWQNATWSGASTPEEVFACAAGKYAAAYRFTDAGLERFFPERPDISNMNPLAQYDAFLILITQPVTCVMPVTAASGSSRTLQWDAGWNNAGWSGTDGTAPQQSFACAEGSYAAAYRYVAGGLERYFPGRPDISNMGPLNKYNAFLILVTGPVTCTMSVGS